MGAKHQQYSTKTFKMVPIRRKNSMTSGTARIWELFEMYLLSVAAANRNFFATKVPSSTVKVFQLSSIEVTFRCRLDNEHNCVTSIWHQLLTLAALGGRSGPPFSNERRTIMSRRNRFGRLPPNSVPPNTSRRNRRENLPLCFCCKLSRPRMKKKWNFFGRIFQIKYCFCSCGLTLRTVMSRGLRQMTNTSRDVRSVSRMQILLRFYWKTRRNYECRKRSTRELGADQFPATVECWENLLIVIISKGSTVTDMSCFRCD